MVLSLLLVARSAPWPAALPRLPRVAIVLVALAGFGTGLLFLEGQWDGVSVLGLAAAYALWRRDRPAAAGFALGFTAAIAKPQLVIGVAAYMIGRRDWRAAGGALAGAAVTIVIGLIGAGPHALTSFITAIATPSNSPTAQMQGTTGLFGSLLRPRVRRVPAGSGSRDRRCGGGRMAGNGGSSPARSFRAIALRRRGALALRVASSAGARPDAPRSRARGRARLAGRPTRGASVAGPGDPWNDRSLGAALVCQPGRSLPEHGRLPRESDAVGPPAHRRGLLRPRHSGRTPRGGGP